MSVTATAGALQLGHGGHFRPTARHVGSGCKLYDFGTFGSTCFLSGRITRPDPMNYTSK